MKTAVSSAKSSSFSLAFTDFKEITKARLAMSVVFSSIAGYLLAPVTPDVYSLLLLLLEAIVW